MQHALQRLGFAVLALSVAFHAYNSPVWGVPPLLLAGIAAAAGVLVLLGVLLRVGLLVLAAVTGALALAEGFTALGGIFLGSALLCLSLALAQERHLGAREKRLLQRVFRSH